VVRPVLQATLTGDHRALDGLVGATFLHRLAALLQDAP
jgi:pyruvate/2-oxoglutarate dehydrogenase complex dihydrolipoamide acyltransferase (E2) component